jgi:hypothetical protein
MDKRLEEIVATARATVMSPAERESQRRSFAYGNTKIENDRITRDTINTAAETLKADEPSE